MYKKKEKIAIYFKPFYLLIYFAQIKFKVAYRTQSQMYNFVKSSKGVIALR